MRILTISLLLLPLIGTGCLIRQRGNTPEAKPVETSIKMNGGNDHASLCLNFQDRDGFMRWLDAYEAEDTNALLLARNVKLPDVADAKLISNIRDSLTNEHLILRFLCVLDDAANIVTWMVDDMNPSNTSCKAVQYMSIYGVGTIADLNADGRTDQCEELCKPKIQTPEMLVWQCDLREGPETTWTELHQERLNGRTLPFGCKEDAKGVTEGCTR